MTETWSWIDADGVVHPMTLFAEGLAVMEGVAGRGMPAVRITRDTVAGQAGQRTRDVKHDLRALTIPVAIEDLGELELLAQLRAWMHNFDPARGDGILLVEAADGNTRQLTCRYESGLEVVEDDTNRIYQNPPAQLAVVSFTADVPYWEDVADESVLFSTTTSAPTWFGTGNILPIQLGSSTVIGGATVTVDSDVEVWPIWTITGPGTDLVLRNNTTGRQLVWNGTLTGGQVLTIDTRPGVKTVQREDGSNQFGDLTAWDLWPLTPGDDDLDVTMSGTTAGVSKIVATWRNAHLTS